MEERHRKRKNHVVQTAPVWVSGCGLQHNIEIWGHWMRDVCCPWHRTDRLSKSTKNHSGYLMGWGYLWETNDGDTGYNSCYDNSSRDLLRSGLDLISKGGVITHSPNSQSWVTLVAKCKSPTLQQFNWITNASLNLKCQHNLIWLGSYSWKYLESQITAGSFYTIQTRPQKQFYTITS